MHQWHMQCSTQMYNAVNDVDPSFALGSIRLDGGVTFVHQGGRSDLVLHAAVAGMYPTVQADFSGVALLLKQD